MPISGIRLSFEIMPFVHGKRAARRPGRVRHGTSRAQPGHARPSQPRPALASPPPAGPRGRSRVRMARTAAPGPCAASRPPHPELPSLPHAALSAVSEHVTELLGLRQSPRSFPPSRAPLESRPLRSAGITRLLRYSRPIRHPVGPSWPSRVPGWRVRATDGASRVAAVSLLHACCRQYPGGDNRCSSFSSRSLAAFPEFSAGRPPQSPFRGLLGVPVVAACVLAESPTGDPLPSECFSPCRYLHEPLRLLPAGTTVCRTGFAPAGAQCLSTAHEN